MGKINAALLSRASKKIERKEKGNENISSLFREFLEFTNTSEVDFNKFTPETLVAIMEYQVANEQVLAQNASIAKDFMKACAELPTVKHRRFAACM